jgi:diguanylate cyclase (GGDEF)-like protein
MTKFFQVILRKKSLLGSYVIILILTVIAVSFSIYTSTYNTNRMQEVIQTNDYHLNLVARMHAATRERIITLYKMTLEEDPFLRDELFTTFNQMGTKYIITRNELMSAETNEDLRALLREQDKVTQPLGSMNKLIADMAIEGRIDEARKILIEQAAPLQEEMFLFFRDMNNSIAKIDQQTVDEVKSYRKWSEKIVIISTILIIVFILRIAIKSITREVYAENQLRLEKRKSDVTLKSIPDGVLLCDIDGLIIDMNPIAADILGIDIKRHKHGKFTSLLAELMHKSESEFHYPASGEVCNITIEKDNDTLTEIEYSASDIMLDRQQVGKIVILRDVTEINNLTRLLSHQAGHDALTGVHNRREFERLLDETLNISRRQSDIDNWLCYIDLDKFKDINDTHGHKAGDQVLITVSECIKECVRATDYIARIGGDEFTVILRHCGNDEARMTTERILSTISSTKLTWEGKQIGISVSIGLVEITDKDHDQSELTSKADHAMYEAKRRGRNRLYVHAA